jgi:creatinine amidohydrolase
MSRELTPRPWLLSESTWETVRQLGYEVAVLPWGATEAHNRHLPYATDTIQVSAIAERSAQVAWTKGAKVLVLPTVPFGVNTGQREVPFCLNMNPSTQMALIADIATSLIDHGVRELVILNGHGGNDFRQIIRELQGKLPLLIAQVNWYQCVNPAEFFDEPGDHAGELETSAMLSIAPDLVRPLSESGPGNARPFVIRAFREGWAWTPRTWIAVTDDTGVGDPKAATAEKGGAYLAAVVEKLAEFLVELAAVAPDALHRAPKISDQS